MRLFNAHVRSSSLQEWPDEVVYHPNNVLTMNGFLSFLTAWYNDTTHPELQTHPAAITTSAREKEKKKKASPGHGKKESKRLSVGEGAGEVSSAHIW